MAVKLGEAVVYLLGDQTGIEKSLEESEKKTTSWASRLAGGVGKFLSGAVVAGAAAAAAAVVGIGVAAFNAGMTMDSAMDTLRVSTGKTGVELEGLQRDFEAVFTSVPTDADTAAGALGELNRRLGYTGETLQDVTERMLRMSDMTGGDAAANAALFSRVVGDWGIANEDAAGTLDKVFAASQQTGVGVEQLMQRVVQFGSPLRLMGFTLDDSIALFAKWEKEGVNAELVMGSLRIAAGKFADAGLPLRDSLLETFDAIKNNTDASAALQLGMETFGARAGPDMVAAIREGRFSIDELAAALENSEGAILDAAAATDDFPEKLEVMRNKATVALAPVGLAIMDVAGSLIDTLGPSLEAAAVWLGENLPGAIAVLLAWWNESLLPAIQTVATFIGENVVPVLTTLAEWLGTNVPLAVSALTTFWNETLYPALQAIWTFIQENLTPIMAGLAAALLYVVVPAFIGWSTAAATAAAATIAAIAPVAAPILAIAAVVALLVKAWEKDWGGIRTTITRFWEETGRPIFEQLKAWLEVAIPTAIAWIKGVIDEALRLIRAWWEENGAAILESARAIWQGITEAINAALAWIQGAIQAVTSAIQAIWARYGDDLLRVASNTWNTIQTIIDTVMGVIRSIISAVQAAIAGDWYTFGAKLREAWDTLWAGVKGVLSNTLDSIETIVGAALDALYLAFTSIWTSIKEAVTTAITGVKEAFTDIDWAATGQAIIDGIKNGIANGANLIKDAALSAARSAFDAVKGFFGIESPSKLMAGLGRNMMQGMALGIAGGAELPALAAVNAGAGVASSVDQSFHVHLGQVTYQQQPGDTLPQTVGLLAMLYGRGG
jgi:TP901 family phage tail tape measure protein